MRTDLTFKLITLLFLIAVSATACRTSGATRGDGQGNDSLAEETMGDEPSAPWAKWTATPGKAPHPVLAEINAFDYWQLHDQTFARELWAALFPILDTLRSHPDATEQTRRSLDAMLALMEPGDSRSGPPISMDVTFLVGEDGDGVFEGVLVRFSRNIERTTPVLSMMLTRHGGDVSPTDVILWGDPAFQESSPFSARLTRSGSSLADGQRTRPVMLGAKRHEDLSSALAIDILSRALWPKLTQEAYLDSALARHEKSGEESDPMPPGFEPAGGLKLRDREIEEVLSDTAFPPSLGDDFDLGGGPDASDL